MKKSTIFLLIAIGIATCWSLILGFMTASTLNNYQKGKGSSFAKSDKELIESKKKTFPAPVHILYISGEGTANLIFHQGKELTILAHPKAWAFDYTKLKNGDAILRITKLQNVGDINDITIILPGIQSISFDDFVSVTLDGFYGSKLGIQGSRFLSFNITKCKIGFLKLNFPKQKDQQQFLISYSNQIDTLIADVKGWGNFRLEMAGKLSNQISLSESMKLEASNYLTKILALK